MEHSRSRGIKIASNNPLPLAFANRRPTFHTPIACTAHSRRSPNRANLLAFDISNAFCDRPPRARPMSPPSSSNQYKGAVATSCLQRDGCAPCAICARETTSCSSQTRFIRALGARANALPAACPLQRNTSHESQANILRNQSGTMHKDSFWV